MFAKILNGNITLNRGDNLSTPIYILTGDKLSPTPYTLLEEDTLYFAIMEPHQAFENAIVKKVYNSNSDKDGNGNIILKLNSIDTTYLNAGKYYYSLKLENASKEVITLINDTLFDIIGVAPTNDNSPKQYIENIIFDGGELIP